MNETDPKVGVCILRVESQPNHVLITVTTNRHLDRSLYSTHPERVQQFSDPEAALQEVANFLHFFS
jgi:hypothetical protein